MTDEKDVTAPKPTQEIPTPRLGLIKGILMIAFGFALAFEMFLGLPDINSVFIGWGWLLVILALFLWRGIIAIVNRNRKRIGKVTIGVWSVLLVGVVFLLIWLLV